MDSFEQGQWKQEEGESTEHRLMRRAVTGWFNEVMRYKSERCDLPSKLDACTTKNSGVFDGSREGVIEGYVFHY